MTQRENNQDPASKSGKKPPRPYQAYIIAAIVIVIGIFYLAMYW